MIPSINPIHMLQPQRKIIGVSAILLPFTDEGAVDWAGFEDHMARTAVAGLIPAVNMDTGYANLINAATRQEVLRRTREIMGSHLFIAGAFVAD